MFANMFILILKLLINRLFQLGFCFFMVCFLLPFILLIIKLAKSTTLDQIDIIYLTMYNGISIKNTIIMILDKTDKNG